MASPNLLLSAPLVHEAHPSRTHFVGKVIAVVSVVVGLCCVAAWTSGEDEQYASDLQPATSMNARSFPMQRALHALPVARPRNFLQPVRASRSPFELEIDIPINIGISKVPSGELDILVPVTERGTMAAEAEVKKVLQSPITKREMLAATAAIAAAATHGAANAYTPGADNAEPKIKKPESPNGIVKRGAVKRPGPKK